MKKVILISCFFMFSVTLNANTLDFLWQTPDQKGYSETQKGNYKKANTLFQNPLWKAATDYKSGQFQQALNFYNTQTDPEGLYNKGNTLAQLKRYQEAIEAYDKAIKLAPGFTDAVANRDLVKKLLAQQALNPQQQQQEQLQQQQQQQQQSQPQQQQQLQQQEKQMQQSLPQQQQQKELQNQQQQQQQSQPQQQQQLQQQEKQMQQSEPQQQQQKELQNQQKQQQQMQPQQQEQLQKQQQQISKNPASAKDELKNKESSHADKQWLKLIPEEPKGLLQEKFLRDHYRRMYGWESQ